MSIVFIDTEFTDFVKPTLLSFGAVSSCGRELYLELDMSTPDGRKAALQCTSFVQDTVLPQFGLHPVTMPSQMAIGSGIADWFLSFGGGVEVVYDFRTDAALLVRALRSAGRWDELSGVVRADIFNPSTPAGEAAAEEAFRESERQGLFRHHALADARALRAAFLVEVRR